MIVRLGLLWLMACLFPVHAHAHEMGTSALIVSEWQSGAGTLVFKRSKSADGTVPPIEFQFSPACTLSNTSTEWEEDREVIQKATFQCNKPLKEHTLNVSGFSRLAPDLIATVHATGQPPLTFVFSPKRAEATLGTEPPSDTSSLDYFLIGIEHIVFGWDHVLFVAALFLLWQRRNELRMRLLTLFTVFTVGHSLTLALVVLDLIAVPTRAIEAWIALSILWFAVQLAREPNTKTTASAKGEHPLILLFGLLHGSGFALSMQERGFPADAVLGTLFSFNLGIEAGQLLIVGTLLILFHLLNTRHLRPLNRPAQAAMILGIGGASLFWTVERIYTYA